MRAQGPLPSHLARVGPGQRGVAWRGVACVARVCPSVIDGSTELPPRPTMRTGGVPGYQARPAVLGICGEPIKGCRPLAGDYCTAFQLCFGANQGGGVAQEASGSACAYLIAPRRSLSGAADYKATALGWGSDL